MISAAADRPVKLTLENHRVHTINGDALTYDTGRKIITIRADSAKSRRFLKEVKDGRKSARADVTLTPQRKSPFNTAYKAR